MEKLKAKVCIVGSEVAGSLCAKHLSEKIDDILILERGTSTNHQWRVQFHRQEQEVPTAVHHHVVAKGRQDEFQRGGGGTVTLQNAQHTVNWFIHRFTVFRFFDLSRD